MYTLIIITLLGCNKFNIREKVINQDKILNLPNITENNIDSIIEGYPILHLAAKKGDANYLKQLIVMGADILAKDKNGKYVYELDVKEDVKTIIKDIEHMAAFEIILSEFKTKGIDIKQYIRKLIKRKNSGEIINLPELAVKYNRLNLLLKMTRVGIDIDSNLISLAIKNEFQNIVFFLLSNLDNLDRKDIQGRTILMNIIIYGHKAVEMSKNLIDELIKKSNVDLQDKDGNTALMLAVIKEDYNMARLILKKSYNLDLKDKDGRTALMIARILNQHQIADKILNKINYNNYDKNIIIDYSINNDYDEYITNF